MVSEKPKTLEDIWRDQEAFNRQIVNYDLLVDDPSKEEWLRRYWIALVDEGSELIRKTNFKVHRLRRQPLNRAALNEELIDMFKYWLSMAQVLGMTSDEFLEEYHRKSEVVRDKWRRELLRLRTETKVAVFDIDGVLNDWPVAWLAYVNEQLKVSWAWEAMTSWYISDCFPLSRNTEEELKAQFRENGYLSRVPPKENAGPILRMLWQAGYKIAIITGRPYNVTMHYDIISWFKQHDLPYDLIMWGEDKADVIYAEISPAEPAFVVEDKPSTVQKLKSRRYTTYVMDWPYNRQVPEEPGVVERITKLTDIAKKLSERL